MKLIKDSNNEIRKEEIIKSMLLNTNKQCLCVPDLKKRERAKLYMLRNKKENINTESGKMQRTYITNFGNKETFGMGKVFFLLK